MEKIAPYCFACGVVVVFTAICSVSLELRKNGEGKTMREHKRVL